MNKIIKLSISERMALIDLLNSYAGNISGLHKTFGILSQIEINDQEKKKINWEIKPSPENNGMFLFKFDKKKAKEKGIDLEEGQIKVIEMLATIKSSKNGFTLADKFLVDVLEKLEINIKEEPINPNPQGQGPMGRRTIHGR